MALSPHLVQLRDMLQASPCIRDDHRTFFLANLERLTRQQTVELSTHIAQAEQTLIRLTETLRAVPDPHFWRGFVHTVHRLGNRAREATEAVLRRGDRKKADALVARTPRSHE